MNEAEFIKSLIDMGTTAFGWATNTAMLVGIYKLWSRFAKLQENVNTLNHNSSQITKVLLRKKLIEPEEIKDVSLA